MFMIIKITQFDIDIGRQNSRISCPIALAVKRMTGRYCSVCPQYIKIGLFEESRQIFFQKVISDKIRVYDKTGEMIPFSFELNI